MGQMQMAEAAADRVSLRCAFCNGVGKDPFGLLYPLSTCQVCNGRGEITFGKPFATCAFCKGSGVHPSHRYTCIVCHGRGVIPAPPEAERSICPDCGGRGRTCFRGPCLACKGKGFVAVERLAATLGSPGT